MIEIIAMTPEDARRIEVCGADRIELISSLSEGGLTPSWAIIKNVVQAVSIPVNVMIRPHSRSFMYSDEEIDIMKEDIIAAKELGVNGVVFGALNEAGYICEDALKEFFKVCDGLDVTFHRAIDELANPVEGMEVLSKYAAITAVLTSGGKGNILNNLPVISEMVKHSGHINVMAGGGLNFDNIEQAVKQSGVREYHFGTAVRDGRSPYGNINIGSLSRLVKIIKGRS